MEDLKDTRKNIEALLKGKPPLQKGSAFIFYYLEDYQTRSNPRIFIEETGLQDHLHSKVSVSQPYVVEDLRKAEIKILTEEFYLVFSFQGEWKLCEFSDRHNSCSMDWETVPNSHFS